MKSKQRAARSKSSATLKLTRSIPRRRSPWNEVAATMIGEADATALPTSQTRTSVGAIPVILIEDNRLLLQGLSAVLSAQGLEVIGTAANGSAALRQIAKLRPHIVLLDATLGDRNSVGVVRALKKVFPEMKIVVMQLLPAQDDVLEFVRAGVSGFIMKDASITDIASTIRTVADGGSVAPPKVTATLFSHVADVAITSPPSRVKAAMRMTTRERAVATLIADGNGNTEIAAELGLSTNSVRSHVHNILEKFALHMRLDRAAEAHARREQDTGFQSRKSGRKRKASEDSATPPPESPDSE